MLKSDKLTLRALRREDMETACRYSNDLELELLGGGDPPRPRTLEGWLAWYDDKVVKNEGPNADFAIEADGKFIGFCGLWHFDLAAQNCELGISIGEREYWSRGYGREAIRLITDYAFRYRNIRKVWLTTYSNNPRAVKCYLAAGFVEEGRLREHAWNDGAFVDQIYMGLYRPDLR